MTLGIGGAGRAERSDARRMQRPQSMRRAETKAS
jgi:hypothetical protein